MHRYPPELNESIWSLMKAGCGPSEIKQRIDSGEAIKLGKAIPYRTVQHKMTMLRRSRGEPEVDGQPVPELAEAIASEFLNGARRQLS
jgi:hypothetical protein